MEKYFYENAQWGVTKQGEMFCKKIVYSIPPKLVITERIDWIEEMQKLPWLDMSLFVPAFDTAFVMAKAYVLVGQPLLKKAIAWKESKAKYKDMDVCPFMDIKQVA